MTSLLLSPGQPPQPVIGIDDPRAVNAPGPAVIVTPSEEDAAAGRSAAPTSRPLAYREAGGQWHVIGSEAADHWSALSPELSDRLLADRAAGLDVEEFKAITNGASASMITNNWVHSGHPRRYRIAGELRELAEVVAALSGRPLTPHAPDCR